MAKTFKVGDTVIGNERARRYYGITTEGWAGIVTKVDGNGTSFSAKSTDGSAHVYSHLDVDNFDLLKEKKDNTIKTMAKTLTEKFKLAMTSEPKKTFIKKGICNPDGSFTPEGRELFEQYQLTKLGDDFKKDVVDLIPEDDK